MVDRAIHLRNPLDLFILRYVQEGELATSISLSHTD